MNTYTRNILVKGVNVLSFSSRDNDTFSHSVTLSSLSKITITNDKSLIDDARYSVDDKGRMTLKDYPLDEKVVKIFNFILTVHEELAYQQTEKVRDDTIFIEGFAFNKSELFEYDKETEKIYLKSGVETLLCLLLRGDENTLQYLKIMDSETIKWFRILFDGKSNLTKIVVSYLDEKKKVYKNIYTFLGKALEEETSYLVFSTTGCKQFTLVTPRV